MTEDPTMGMCDCGEPYWAVSRAEHNADTGQCWDCSPIKPNDLTDDEWNNYINGEELPTR